MDPRLLDFIRPLLQDLDGVSRLDEVERVSRIARRLYTPPSPADARAFELLLLFHRLGNWLGKVGNLTRTALATGVGEAELHRLLAQVRRLHDVPQSDAEYAAAAAILIDAAGVRGLAERLARARREGMSVEDVARDELREPEIPQWFPAEGRVMLMERNEARRKVCRAILEEIEN